MISAIVPTYQSGSLLDRCVEATLPFVDELIVLDGGSSDGAPQRAAGFDGVRLVVAPELGPHERLNRGLREARGEHVLILNDDAWVDPGTVDRLASVLAERPAVALAGAVLRGVDGTPQKSGGRVRTLGAELRWVIGLPVAGEPVSMVPLCCALGDRRALVDVGGIDESFGFYFDDEDICRRLIAAGRDVVIDPAASAVHVGGGSTRARDPAGWFRRFQRARVLYLRKHYPRGWVLFAFVWAARAMVHAAFWTLRGLIARARGDAAGARRARAWVDAFADTIRPPS